jgi:hypothetical protein
MQPKPLAIGVFTRDMGGGRLRLEITKKEARRAMTSNDSERMIDS